MKYGYFLLFSLLTWPHLFAQKSIAQPAIFQKLSDSVAHLMDRSEYDSAALAAKAGLQLANEYKNLQMMPSFSFQSAEAYASLSKNDSAFKYYKNAELLAVQASQPGKVFDAQLRIMSLSFSVGSLIQEDEYYNKLIKEIDTIRTPSLRAKLYNGLGSYYSNKNEYEKSIDQYLKYVTYSESVSDSENIGVGYVNIGNDYLQMSKSDKALPYFIKAYPMLRTYVFGQVICANNIVATYINLKKYDSSVYWSQQYIRLSKSIKDTEGIYSGYQKLALALAKLKQYDKAESYLNEANSYFKKSGSVVGLIDGYTFMGQLLSDKKQYQQALENYKNALYIAHKNQHLERETEVYKLMAEAADSAGLYKDAYNYHYKYSVLWDSITQESNKKNIAELETKYQTKNKEQQINLLNQQAKTKDIQLSAQKRTRWFLFAALCLVALVAIFIYRSFLLKRKNNVLLEKINRQLDDANQSKTKLFSIISHDLRAPISSLFNFLELNKEQDKEKDALRKKKIQQSAENILEAMEDILLWSKSQMESFVLSKEEINLSLLINEITGIYSSAAAQKNIQIDCDCPSIITITTDANFLKTILRNLLGNAIKFTPAQGEIKISAQKTGNQKTQITVSDNGSGMTGTQQQQVFEWQSIRSQSSGLGLKLTKELVEKLNGTISVSSEEGKGTVFVVTL